MKVLVVCRYKPHLTGHAAPFIIEQCNALRAVGCEAELFPLRGNYWKQWKSLRHKISEFKPDVIHAHYGLSCLVANLATRRVPVVSTYHGSDINQPKIRPLSKLAIGLSAWNIFVSKRNMALVGAVDGKKASLTPCGVSLSEDQLRSREEARKALGWKADEKKVLFAGAFDNAVKDPELAKEVIASLNDRMSREHCSLNEPLSLNDVELIELKGYTREEVNRLMCACDCLLMTSKTEGSPQVNKEAMACGCPVVTIDVGDVRERLDGVSGCYVVDRGASIVDRLAIAIEKAIAFKGKTNGREKILEYGLSNEQVAQKIMDIYKRILNN